MKLVHAADIHLDSPLRGLEHYEGAPVEALRGATRKAFERLVDLCIDENAALLLIAGDIFDGDWKDFHTGLFFRAQLVRLREAGIAVVMVRGNHDAAAKITKQLSLPDNAVVLDHRAPQTRHFEALDIAVHGQSFAQREVLEDLSQSYPAPVPGVLNIGLLHTALDGREGHDPYAPCKLESLVEKGYDYWALGHVHAREVLHRDPWVVFPGNLQGRHVRETGSKGATVIHVEDRAIVDIEHRGLEAVRWAHLRVQPAGEASLENLLAQCERAIEAELEGLDDARVDVLALRLELGGEVPEAMHRLLWESHEALRFELRALTHELDPRIWLEKLRLETRPQRQAVALEGREDALGELWRALRDADADPGQLLEGVTDIQTLRGRLPEEYMQLPGAFDLRDTSSLDALVEEARQLLLTRLAQRSQD